jgi:sigma-B regulation protein RsbU (phosphoserine phosphatase)
MRTLAIALIAADPVEAGRPINAHGTDGWWEDVFRHWPSGMPTPRIERVAPDNLVVPIPGTSRTSSPWDAALLYVSPTTDEAALCQALDTVQHSNVPTLLLTSDRTHRLDDFHVGSVLVQSIDADPRQTAAMLYALASRQAAVRSMDQNLRLAQSFQGETAAEIDRLHQELLLAARVQRDFMPKHMPELEGLAASVLFRPAGFVSGDTYDVFRLDDDHVGFFIADAMGHGVPAALMTLYISGSLPRREIINDQLRIVPPAEALTRLNASLHECLAGPSRFVTAIYGVANTRTGVIDLACAGHPPPLRISQHGVVPVEVSGMLLGVVADYEYEQISIRLDKNEILVLHSDGVEAAVAPRSSTSDLPHSVIPAHHGLFSCLRRGDALRDLQTAMTRLAHELDSKSGSLHQEDDLTVLALQTVPRPARTESDNHTANNTHNELLSRTQ